MSKLSISMVKEKTYTKIREKWICKNKAVINQSPRFGIDFGIALAAVTVHRVKPADYIGCG
jgi:hypothetical protein